MTINLTASEKRKAYLLQYYFETNPLFVILRLIGGPAIIGLGFYFLLYGQLMSVLFFIICILYGVFYISKPFLSFLFYASYFSEETFELEMTKDQIILKNGNSNTDFLWTQLRKIIKYKSTYILIFQDKSRIIIPLSQLKASEIEWIEAQKKLYC